MRDLVGTVLRRWREPRHVGRKGTFRLEQLEQPPGVVDRRLDLAAMTHDRRVAEQSLDLALPVPCDHLGVEVRECATERLALAEDREPRQAGLEPFEAELLEQPPVVRDRHPPLVVVVAAVVGVVARPPPAADDAILVADEAVREIAHRTMISIGSVASGTPPSGVTSQVSCM